MKSITKLQDLERFGIIPLTGEADALSFRILCDLTSNGKRIVKNCLSLTDTAFHEPWNSRDNQVASCLISLDLVPSLGVIALVLDGAHTVFSTFRVHGNVLDESGIYTTTAIHGLYGADEWYRHPTGHMDSNDCWVTDTPAMVAFDGYEITFDDEGKYRFGRMGRMFQFGQGPREGTLNVHAMTGRVI